MIKALKKKKVDSVFLREFNLTVISDKEFMSISKPHVSIEL